MKDRLLFLLFTKSAAPGHCPPSPPIRVPACDIVGTFRRPTLQWFGALVWCPGNDSVPGELCPLCHPSLRPCDNVTSTFFNSTFASERLQVRTWGRKTGFLPWATSNLVAPLLTYKCCYSFSHAAIWFNQSHYFRQETHPLTLLVLEN